MKETNFAIIHRVICPFLHAVCSAEFNFNDKVYSVYTQGVNYQNYSHINIFNAAVFLVEIRPGFVFISPSLSGSDDVSEQLIASGRDSFNH